MGERVNIIKGISIVCLLLCISNQAWSKELQAVKATELAKSNLSWDGNPLPSYPTEKPEVTIMRIIIPAGAQLPLHEHPVINAGVLISGELTVITKEGKTLHLKAGDPIIEVVSTWHYGKNEGSLPADIIVFYAGVAGKPITIKQAQ